MAAGDIYHRNQLVDERDLEGGSRSLDHEPVLRRPMFHGDHHSTTGTHFQAHQVVGPVLVLRQVSSLGDEDIVSPERLDLIARCQSDEGDLLAFLAPPDRTHGETLTPDLDDAVGLDMDEVFVLDVDADEPVEPIGLSESADDDAPRCTLTRRRGGLSFSRGTRRQR